MVLQVFFTLYQVLCVFLPCLIYQWFNLRRKTEHIPLSNLVWRFLFILYLYMVIYVTGVGTLWDIFSYPEIIRLEEISLIPFQAGSFLTNLLNTFMFIPFGFLLPLIWRKYRNFSSTVLLGAGFSMMIELLQLFNRRVSDIDDFMMNTLGAFLGFLVWRSWQLLVRKDSKEIVALGKNEAVCYVLLSLGGTFFFYNWRFFLRFL
ncbi:VanZ family protein [Enterococcus sp. AZ072]|uniref:VanZ family protein n=1 Tax=unclassified Enterococcus TaxID=2608891 RepID=UPI003D2E4860